MKGPVFRLLRELDEHEVVIVADADVQEDGVELWEMLEEDGFIEPTEPGTRVMCTECENLCFVEPTCRSGPNGEYLFTYACATVGEHIQFAANRFRRWRINLEVLARWLMDELEIEGDPDQLSRNLRRLGDVGIGRHRRTYYLSRGLHGPNLQSRLESFERSIVDHNAVLLIPSVIPDRDVWPDPPCSIFALANTIRVVTGMPCMDESTFSGATARVRRFQDMAPIELPEGVSWNNIIVRVRDNRTLEIAYRNHVEQRTFVQMGMRDYRKPEPEPDAVWEMLLDAAEAGGKFTWREKKSDVARRNDIKRLRKRLRQVIRLPDKPIADYDPRIGWKCNFNLVDWRGVPA